MCTELDVECEQQSAIVVDCRPYLLRLPLPPGAVNNRPIAVAVYIALADGRCLVLRFFEYRVCDKFQMELHLFWRYPNFCKTRIVEGIPYAKIPAQSVQRFRYNTGVWETDRQTDRQTDRHMTTANTRAQSLTRLGPLWARLGWVGLRIEIRLMRFFGVNWWREHSTFSSSLCPSLSVNTIIKYSTSPVQCNMRRAASQSPHWLQWDAPNSTPKLSIPFDDNHPNIIHPSVDRPHSPFQTSSRSTQPFYHNTLCGQTDRQATDRQTDRSTDGPSECCVAYARLIESDAVNNWSSLRSQSHDQKLSGLFLFETW